MKNKNALAALVAVGFWMIVAPVVLWATTQNSISDANGVPTLMIESGTTNNEMMRVHGEPASGSVFVTIVGAGLATNTIAISPITTYETKCVSMTTLTTSGTSLNPTVKSDSFMLSNEGTQTMRFALNATASPTTMFLPAGAIVSWGDDIKFSTLSVYNAGTVSATACALIGRI